MATSYNLARHDAMASYYLRRLVIQPIYVTTMALCAIVTSIPQVIGTSLACA